MTCAHEAKPAPTRRILIVEDNLDQLHSLARVLQDLGHVVEWAINGYAAFNITHDFKPDYVIVDLGLPGMSGYELCRQLKASRSRAGVELIVHSAYSTPEHQARAKALGCTTYIVKPAPPNTWQDLFGDARAPRRQALGGASQAL